MTTSPEPSRATLLQHIATQHQLLVGLFNQLAWAESTTTAASAPIDAVKAATDPASKTIGEHVADAGFPVTSPKKVGGPPKAPAPTSQQIADELKTKLIALVARDRVKAVAIIAAVGAKRFSEIPVETHTEVLLALSAALAPANDDPLG